MGKQLKFINMSYDDLKSICWNKYRTVTPKIVDSKLLILRFKHMERVSEISMKLLNLYLSELNSKVLTKSDKKQLKIIKKKKLENSVVFISLIHDMYKFCESDKLEHGVLAASFFKNLCKKNKIAIKGEYKLMYEALKNHSDKKNKDDNIYIKILQDADILSKYHEENIEEKMIKNKISAKDEIIRFEKVLKDDNYKPRTPFFYNLQQLYKVRIINKYK